jgi:GNAT superfamily N-acetyltransferase
LRVIDARQATTNQDVRRAGLALGRAFHDDPVFSHFLPPEVKDREKRMTAFFTMAAKGVMRHQSLWIDPEGVAAAIWKPPGHWKMGMGELLRGTPTMISVLRRRMPVALSALNAIEARHPTEPHWYLEGLGTEPEHQGKGRGARVMRPILDRCDREGVPAYLESSKEANVPFYERHGFRVTDELTLPKGGPPVWLMWRDPR